MKKITLSLLALLLTCSVVMAAKTDVLPTGWRCAALSIKAGTNAAPAFSTYNYYLGGISSVYGFSKADASFNSFDGTDFGAVDSLKLLGGGFFYADTMNIVNNISNGIKTVSYSYKVMDATNTTVVVPETELWGGFQLMKSTGTGAPYDLASFFLPTRISTNPTVNGIDFAQLLPGGIYKLHMWAKAYRGTFKGVAYADTLLNNNGADYVATFTVPSKATDVVFVSGANGIADGTGYHSLAAAFNAINCNPDQSGKNIEISIAKSYTETVQAELRKPSVASWNSLIIYPSATGVVVTGLFNYALVSLKGTSNVTITGKLNKTGASKSLSLINMYAGLSSAFAVYLCDDASYCTITDCILKAASPNNASGIIYNGPMGLTASNAIYTPVTTTGTASAYTNSNGNDYISITNNYFNSASTTKSPQYAIQAYSSSTGPSDNLLIENNQFFDIFRGDQSFNGFKTAGGISHIVRGNHFYESAPVKPTSTATYYGIYINNANSTTVENNYFGGSSPYCVGKLVKSNEYKNNFYGIYFTTYGAVNNIQGNYIKNISWKNSGTSAATCYGIYSYTSANNTLNIGTTTGNTISNIEIENAASVSTFCPIQVQSNTTTTNTMVNCENNLISAIKLNSTAAAGGYKFAGILTSYYGGYKINNNRIHNVAITGSSTATTNYAAGIYMSYSTGTNVAPFTISNNVIDSISNDINTSNTANIIAGIYWNNPNSYGNVYNNYISNFISTGTAPAPIYGVNFSSTHITNATAIFNNVIALGNNNPGVVYGISTGVGLQKTYFNTVALTGAPTTGAFESAALNVPSSAITTGRELKNNIFVNTRTGGTAKHYAAKMINVTGLAADYNDYYATVLGSFNTVDKTGISDWQLITGLESHSVSADPLFIGTGLDALYYQSTASLTPTAASLTDANGVAITKDYSNTDRSLSDQMGAFIRTLPNNISQDNQHTTAIYASNMSIVVKNAEEIASVVVYDAIGNTVKRTATSGSTVVVPMTERGIFIVHVAGKAGKIYTQRVIMK